MPICRTQCHVQTHRMVPGGIAPNPDDVRSIAVQCRIAELQCKDVINIADGQRLGCVEDVVVDAACGKILALVLPGSRGLFRCFSAADDILIRWECVKRIGDEVILVEKCGEPERCRRRKHFCF